MRTIAKNQISKPNKKFNLIAIHQYLIIPEPMSYRQALRDERWCNSMSEEITGQMEKDT